MNPLLLRIAAVPVLGASFAGQFLLQRGALRRENEVRSSRTLRTAPSSLAFRLAACGVKEAAADALWLTVLPKLGQPWVEPDRKSAWIESVTNVMIDANPRALTPPLFAAYFLEFLDRRNPAIERVLRRAMEAERRAPFRERRKVNDDSWELPHTMAMNLWIYGGPEAREKAVAWLKASAARPDCPAIVIDLIGAEGFRRGNPLDGWLAYLHQAAIARPPGWKEYHLGQADEARVAVLRGWARAAEVRLGRWPGTLDEVLAEAPAGAAELLLARPPLREELVRDVVLLPSTRDLEIPALTKRKQDEGLARLRLLALQFETVNRRKPRTLDDLRTIDPGLVDPPPRRGTKWDLDASTGEPAVVPDPADPRTRR